MPQTILVAEEEVHCNFPDHGCTFIKLIVNPFIVCMYSLRSINLFHSSYRSRIKFGSNLLRIGSHIGDQMPYLLKSFVNLCSSTSCINALAYGKQAIIEVLDLQLVTSLMIRVARTKFFYSLPILVKCLTMMLPYATYFIPYNSSF